MTNRPRELGRPSRDEIVRAQYQFPEAASGYAASHDDWRPSARYFHSRLHAVEETLRPCPGGDLLDVGRGPGMLVRHLLDTRPGDFRIAACDQSPAMVDAAAARISGAEDARVMVARIGELPLPRCRCRRCDGGPGVHRSSGCVA